MTNFIATSSIFCSFLITLFFITRESDFFKKQHRLILSFTFFFLPEILSFFFAPQNLPNISLFFIKTFNHPWNFDSGDLNRLITLSISAMLFVLIFKGKSQGRHSLLTQILSFTMLKILFWIDDYFIAICITLVVSNLWVVGLKKRSMSKFISLGPWILFGSSIFLMQKAYLLTGSTLLSKEILPNLYTNSQYLSVVDFSLLSMQFLGILFLILIKKSSVQERAEILLVKALGVIILVVYLVPIYRSYISEYANQFLLIATILGIYPVFKKSDNEFKNLKFIRHILLLATAGVVQNYGNLIFYFSLVLFLAIIIYEVFDLQQWAKNLFQEVHNVIFLPCFWVYWIILYPDLIRGNIVAIIFWLSGIYLYFLPARNRSISSERNILI